MYSYAYGYFRFGDLFKAGVFPALILIVLDALWTPFVVGDRGALEEGGAMLQAHKGGARTRDLAAR